jgi:predicted nucleic acid-binding protein
MTTYLLDTNVIIDALRGKQNRVALLTQLLQQGHLLACSSVQVSEVYAGMRPHEEAATEELLRSLEYFEVDWETARLAKILKRDYSGKRITLAVADATIAAVALSHQMTLITDNPKHYPMKELQFFPLKMM